MIYDGFFERHSKLRIIAAHGGGALPFLVSRMDQCYHHIPACRERIARPPSDYLPLIHADAVVFAPEVSAFYPPGFQTSVDLARLPRHLCGLTRANHFGGVSDGLGITCSDAAEAELKKAAVSMSQTRILLVDSRKFGRVRPAWFAELRDFDAVVTDPGISLEYVEIFRSLGIALHVV
jgi:hypothetical protein